MKTFSDEEMKVLKELVGRLRESFVDPLFVTGHPMYDKPKERRRFLRKLGIKECHKESMSEKQKFLEELTKL